MTPAQIRESVLRKSRESQATLEAFFDAEALRIGACAESMAKAFDAGRRLFTMGNGGSACDALHVAVEFMHPILEKRPPIPAIALGADPALLSAVGNDQDFSLAFLQQLKALGGEGDVLLGISTSGKSANVNRALRAGREMKLLTVGLTGRDGGPMKDVCDYAFVVPSFSTHRIQEAHTAFLHVLWDLVHVLRGHEDVL